MLRRKKPLAPKKNGKPRAAPGKAKGKSLTTAASMLARQACLHEFDHKCAARHQFGIECGTIGGRAYLEWAHIFGRAHARLKFHPENCLALCPMHHDYLDSHPAVKIEFVNELFPERLQKLAELDRTLPKGARPDFWAAYYREAGFTTKGLRAE